MWSELFSNEISFDQIVMQQGAKPFEKQLNNCFQSGVNCPWRLFFSSFGSLLYVTIQASSCRTEADLPSREEQMQSLQGRHLTHHFNLSSEQRLTALMMYSGDLMCVEDLHICKKEPGIRSHLVKFEHILTCHWRKTAVQLLRHKLVRHQALQGKRRPVYHTILVRSALTEANFYERVTIFICLIDRSKSYLNKLFQMSSWSTLSETSRSYLWSHECGQLTMCKALIFVKGLDRCNGACNLKPKLVHNVVQALQGVQTQCFIFLIQLG